MADPTLAAENFFSPAALQNSLAQVDLVDRNTCASLGRLRVLQEQVVALKERVAGGKVASASVIQGLGFRVWGLGRFGVGD